MSRSTGESLRARIEGFLGAASGHEITEDGELLFDRRRTRFRLEESRGKLLLHLWSPERNWVRRVLGLVEESAGRLVLRVERFGRRRPGKLVVALPRHRSRRREGTAARQRYSARLARLLAREFPRARLEGLSTSPDLKRSFSALYARARLREGERWWGVMGVNAGEGAAAVDALLTYALIWFDWNRRRYPERVWAGLRLFLPWGRTQTTAGRLAYIAGPHLAVDLYGVEEEGGTCARMDERDFGNLDTYLAPARHAEETLAAESSAIERIRALAPDAIEAVVPADGGRLSVRFRGLEFARSAGGRVSFGVGRQDQPLTEENFPALAALVGRLVRERTAHPVRRNTSPFFRTRAERWLESLVQAAPQAIDARLTSERLYRQVPALSGGERSVADLLGATRDGQLVVMELKASTDIHLPLQGLDYWLRVRWHQQRGEWGRAGYFPQVNLKPEPPELLLVAPALQFHPTTEAVVSYLVREVQVTLVGINEDWRRQLKVVFRKGPRRAAT